MNEQREYLNETLVDVLKNLPNPFGTFNKARYVLYKGTRGKEIYRFTTTVHTVYECVAKLKKFFNDSFYIDKYFSIYKIQNGEKIRLYASKPADKP